ncbi:lytic transglycosylase domain-containing protein [soil metagenome]
MTRFLITAFVGAAALSTAPVSAAAPGPADAPIARASSRATIPAQLDSTQREAYQQVFANIRAGKWLDAQLQLATMPPGPLHAIAKAEIYTAKGSPRVELEPLMALLNEAPELPQAEQIARMAKARGAGELPALPYTQAMSWIGASSARTRAKSIRSDQIGTDLAVKMQPFVKNDSGEEAEALLSTVADQLTPEALTEWQQKVAWIYYVAGNDASAQRMAEIAGRGVGEWAPHGDWVRGLAAWRQHDCATAGAAFETVGARATDIELRAAAMYWASRADMACGRPDKIEARLKSASQYSETFYGQLARETLRLRDTRPVLPASALVADDWQTLQRRPNIRVAAALVEIGEIDLADEVLRQQAKIGGAAEYAALVRLTGALNCPATQLWLASNGPAGATPPAMARYPAPDWTPDGGWRVDKALVYAHTLQESRFRTGVISAAGAYGLMQIMPAAATDYSRSVGIPVGRSDLTRPSTNMAIGQSHLERLRDMSITGGLLPKVIAAYNAGAMPVQTWNTIVHDGGDPLLYIESIPYWETRGYVATVLRNYWMYEGQAGKPSSSRSALAQGLWPRFPGLPGASAVRLTGTTAPVVIGAN